MQHRRLSLFVLLAVFLLVQAKRADLQIDMELFTSYSVRQGIVDGTCYGMIILFVKLLCRCCFGLWFLQHQGKHFFLAMQRHYQNAQH